MSPSPPRARLSPEAGITLALLAVFGAISLWLIGKLGQEEQVLPALSTYSTQPDGAMALFELLEREGFKPQRYGDTEYEYPPGACVVVAEGPIPSFGTMLLPPVDPKAVLLWVRGGGRLVLAGVPEMAVFQAILDEMNAHQPLPGDAEQDGGTARVAESKGSESDAPMELSKDIPQRVLAKAAGDGRPGRSTALSRLYQPGQTYELPDDRPPLWRDVHTFETAGSTGTLVSQRSDALLGAGLPPDAVVVYRRVGQGAVYLIPAVELFSNDWLDRADNHRLVLALLAQASAGRGLYFDEHFHGFARQRHNTISLLLKTRGGQLLLILAAAVVLLLAGSAIRPAHAAGEPVPARRQAEEMVLAQAGLYQRAQALEFAARWLVDGLKHHVMQARHLASPPDGEQLAQWAAALPSPYARATKVLRSYLDAGLLPEHGRPAALARLAQACHQLRQALG